MGQRQALGYLSRTHLLNATPDANHEARADADKTLMGRLARDQA